MPEVLAVRPGELIGARYRVERVLGQSAMAVVVAARDQRLDELVAIKVLLPQRVANSEVRARFGREARAAVKMKGEHVARVIDVGAREDGTPYMVSEYLEGENLASLLERTGKVPAPEAILYVLQVCDALREAHALGLIHRNLNPADIFLAERRGRPPSLKVRDFGITKVEQRDDGRSKALAGSPRYKAPEQMKSAATVDARSDLWSVGVILYELVTGELPFDAESIPEVVVKVLNDVPALRDAPDALKPLIRRCLAKAPVNRYATVGALAAELRAVHAALVASAPGSVGEGAVLLDGNDAAILDDDDGAIIDEAELLPSVARAPLASRASVALPVFAKAPPQLVMLPAAQHAPARVALAPPATPAPERPPRPQTPQARAQPSHAEPRRRLWLALPIIVVPTLLFAAVRLSTRDKPLAQAEPPASQAPTAETPPIAPAASASADIAQQEPAATVAPVDTPAPPEEPPSDPVAQTPAPTPPPPSTTLAELRAAPAVTRDDDATVALQVAMRHHASLRQACWETSGKTTFVVTVSASIDPSGSVSSASAAAADTDLATCVAAQVRTWTFPPATSTRSLQIPIRFRR